MLVFRDFCNVFRGVPYLQPNDTGKVAGDEAMTLLRVCRFSADPCTYPQELDVSMELRKTGGFLRIAPM